MKNDDSLKSLMKRWEPEFRPDPELLRSVQAEILASDRIELQADARASIADALAEWMRAVFGRPVFAAVFAGLFLFAGAGLTRLLDSGRGGEPDALTVTYRLSIDPLYRLTAVAGVNEVKGQREALGALARSGEPVLAVGLDWLQGQLNLSSQQYHRITNLHSEYEAAFDELFLDLLATHTQYRRLDEKRMSNDVIDYFELYELLQTQRRLAEESSRLTTELLSKVADIIGPEQRDRYERLLHNLYPDLPAAGRRSTNA